MKELHEAAVRQALPAEGEIDIHIFQEIDSTNNEAKRRLNAGCALPALFLAERQSAGRGRQGRQFYSPANAGLYMSLALQKPDRPENAVSITTMAAVAVCRAVRSLTELRPGIKWVNDLYLNGKKICGILAEGVSSGVVIGIGVNVGCIQFPPELEEKARSLELPELDRNQLAGEITAQLLRLYENPADKSYMDDYRAWSIVLGRQVRYGSTALEKTGLALAVEEDGALLVRGPEGLESLRSGEISLRIQE